MRSAGTSPPGAAKISRPRRGGITGLATWAGRLCLATVTGIASRRVAGFAPAGHLRTGLAAGVLASAAAARDPLPGVIFRSGRGCRCTPAAFADLAGDCPVLLSAGRTGPCADTAAAESLPASLAGEPTDTRARPARAGACRAVAEYIAWYNGTRLHSTRGYRSPAGFGHDRNEEIRNAARPRYQPRPSKRGSPRQGAYAI